MKHSRTWLALVAVTAGACSSGGSGDPCELEDQDGIIGGQEVFILGVDDDGFRPPILPAQNQSDVTLTLENEGTQPAGFVIDCLPTPNDDGCPTESCFPDASTIEPIDPGQSATATFRVPDVEGEYIFRAGPGDDRMGQFVVR